MMPTTTKPCVDRVATCSQYGKSVCTTYSGWASDNCRKFCNLCGKYPLFIFLLFLTHFMV